MPFTSSDIYWSPNKTLSSGLRSLDQQSSCLCVDDVCLGLRREAALQTVKSLPNRIILGYNAEYRPQSYRLSTQWGFSMKRDHEVSWNYFHIHKSWKHDLGCQCRRIISFFAVGCGAISFVKVWESRPTPVSCLGENIGHSGSDGQLMNIHQCWSNLCQADS